MGTGRHPDDPEQTLFLYGVEPGSASEEAMQLLAGWTLETSASRTPTPS